MGAGQKLPLDEDPVSTPGSLGHCQIARYRVGSTCMGDLRFTVEFSVRVAAQAGLGQRDLCEGILGLALQQMRRRRKRVGTPPEAVLGVHSLERDSLETLRGQIRSGQSLRTLSDLAQCTASRCTAPRYEVAYPAPGPESGRGRASSTASGTASKTIHSPIRAIWWPGLDSN